MDVGAHPRRENFEGRRKHVVHAAATSVCRGRTKIVSQD